MGKDGGLGNATVMTDLIRQWFAAMSPATRSALLWSILAVCSLATLGMVFAAVLKIWSEFTRTRMEFAEWKWKRQHDGLAAISAQQRATQDVMRRQGMLGK